MFNLTQTHTKVNMNLLFLNKNPLVVKAANLLVTQDLSIPFVRFEILPNLHDEPPCIEGTHCLCMLLQMTCTILLYLRKVFPI